MRPILGIGLQRVVGRCSAGIVAGGVDQAIKAAGARDMGGQGDPIAFFLISRVALSIMTCIRV